MRTLTILAVMPLLLLAAGCKSADAPTADSARNPGLAEQPGDAPANPPVTEVVPPAPAKANAAADPSVNERWMSLTGDYVGPEGLTLSIEPIDDGKFDVAMRWGLDADMTGTFVGEAVEHGIALTRGNERITLRPGSGDDTGMKWLAGKKDCIVVKDGEGYCRK